METILSKLGKYKQTLSESEVFTKTLTTIPQQVKYLRCLALGSPSENNVALYQLAYVILIIEHFKLDSSLYDPVFNDDDKQLFKLLKLRVESDDSNYSSDETLYYLPHAPLDLTEELINSRRPKYLLANSLIRHTDRMTKVKLNREYPTISLMVNLLEQSNGKDQRDGPKHEPKDEPKDEPGEKNEETKFKTVKKRRNQKFIPPVITYDYSQTYFHSIEMTDYQFEGPLNSFSDLSFHVIE